MEIIRYLSSIVIGDDLSPPNKANQDEALSLAKCHSRPNEVGDDTSSPKEKEDTIHHLPSIVIGEDPSPPNEANQEEVIPLANAIHGL